VNGASLFNQCPEPPAAPATVLEAADVLEAVHNIVREKSSPPIGTHHAPKTKGLTVMLSHSPGALFASFMLLTAALVALGAVPCIRRRTRAGWWASAISLGRCAEG